MLSPDITAGAASGGMMTVKSRGNQQQGDTSEKPKIPVKHNGAGLAQATGDTRWAAAFTGRDPHPAFHGVIASPSATLG